MNWQSEIGGVPADLAAWGDEWPKVNLRLDMDAKTAVANRRQIIDYVRARAGAIYGLFIGSIIGALIVGDENGLRADQAIMAVKCSSEVADGVLSIRILGLEEHYAREWFGMPA